MTGPPSPYQAGGDDQGQLHQIASTLNQTAGGQQEAKAWKRRFWQTAIIASAVSVVTGFVVPSLFPISVNMETWFFLGPGLFWLAVFFCSILWFGHQNIREATQPIPSLDQIDRELRLAGYTPTMQDLLAVEARLKSERNEAALLAGGLIVGLHVAARQARGKPPL